MGRPSRARRPHVLELVRRTRLVHALALAAAGCGAPSAPPPAHGTVVQEIRPTEVDRQPLFHFDAGDVIETHDGPGGLVRIHFTRAGTHAVPADDTDADGVPDYVALAADAWEEALDFYAERGFRPPLPDGALAGEHGGDGRFDVYLLDFAHSSDGSFMADTCPPPGDRCIGYAVQENDFAGYGYPSRRYASRVLASHEGFHAIQAAYDNGQGVVFGEGTAVWATEQFDPTLGDLEGFVDGYLADPGRSLDVPPPGPVPPFAYGSALFFQFLSERFDPALIRDLLEHTENGAGRAGGTDTPAAPEWLSQLDLALAADHGSGFAPAFQEFARWNLFTGDSADPERSYANGAAYPEVAVETAELPLAIDQLRVYHASAQYRELPRGRRDTVRAELVSLNDGADLEHLGLFLAVRSGDGKLGRLVEADGPAAEVTLGEADYAVVVGVANGAHAGSSQRPGLCVGSPDEVRSCREALVPDDPGTGGTGGGGAGGAGGTGGEDVEPEHGGGGDGGGCATAGGTTGEGLVAALAALAARFRRRSPRR